MKYIYAIISIVVLSSIFVSYQLLGDRSSDDKIALVVNDRYIMMDEYLRLKKSHASYSQTDKDFIDSLVTKELLIQYAQHEKLDKEPSFEHFMQDFYEKSLIKSLLDKKYASLKEEADDGTTKEYQRFVNRKVHVTFFQFNTLQEAEKSTFEEGEEKELLFNDLAENIKNSILGLHEDKKTVPIQTENIWFVYRLDKIGSETEIQPSYNETDDIKRTVLQNQHEKEIANWLAELRGDAFIKINIKADADE